MPARGKVNASNAQVGDRILIQRSPDARSTEIWPSQTKTGEGVQVARIRMKVKASARRGYVLVTSAGDFYAEPIQTMWLAPEDRAGIKRAHAEALIADQWDHRVNK